MILETFLRHHNIQPDWSVREHQPMHLQILAALHHIMGDRDTTLFPSLLAGVRTGFGPAIPPSGTFPTKAAEPLPNTPLSVHLSNWQSAEQNIQLTRELVAEELDKGFIFKYPGTLEQAQQEYPLGVSVGKLGIATSDSRPPRLVVDSSICGLNSRCVIPEKSTLPSAKELIRSFPLRGSSQLLSGFSLDIKSAHKRIVLHPEERGLVGFSLDGELYFYLVTPFGATFSASWWSRLGGWLLRTFHGLIWFSHCGMLYVDDFLYYDITDDACDGCHAFHFLPNHTDSNQLEKIWVGSPDPMDRMAYQFSRRYNQYSSTEIGQTFRVLERDAQILKDQSQSTGKTDWSIDVVNSNFSTDAHLDSLFVPRPV